MNSQNATFVLYNLLKPSLILQLSLFNFLFVWHYSSVNLQSIEQKPSNLKASLERFIEILNVTYQMFISDGAIFQCFRASVKLVFDKKQQEHAISSQHWEDFLKVICLLIGLDSFLLVSRGSLCLTYGFQKPDSGEILKSQNVCGKCLFPHLGWNRFWNKFFLCSCKGKNFLCLFF